MTGKYTGVERVIPPRMQHINMLHPRRDGPMQIHVSEESFVPGEGYINPAASEAARRWHVGTWMGITVCHLKPRPSKGCIFHGGNPGIHPDNNEAEWSGFVTCASTLPN